MHIVQKDNRSKVLLGCGCWAMFTLAFFIAVGSLSIYTANNVDRRTVTASATQLQIIPDWQTVPFVDLEVVDASKDINNGCSNGYIPVFSRTWFGLAAGCDCTNACPAQGDPADCRSIIPYDLCSESQDQAGCKNITAWPLVYQSRMRGSNYELGRICGKPGGKPFLSVDRPDLATGSCPEGTVPNSDRVQAEYAVCYPPEDLENSSPILDLSIVKNTELDKYPGWKSTLWNDDMTLVWTKDYGKLPLTSFKLEASEPCLDPYDQPKVSSSQFWYKTEMVQGGCATKADTNYQLKSSKNGYSTTVKDLQTDNGVQDILMNAPSSTYNSKTGSDWELYPYGRSTIEWSLECDAQGKTRSDALFALRTPTISTDIQQDFFKTLGIVLVVMFTIWLVAGAPLIFLVGCKSSEKEPRYNIVFITMVYAPLLSLMAWGPMLGYHAQNALDTAENGLIRIQKFNMINECVGEAYQIDTQQTEAELQSAVDTLTALNNCFWVCVVIFIVNAGVLLVHVCSFICCRRSYRDSLAQNHNDGGDQAHLMMKGDSNGYQTQVPQQQAIYQQQIPVNHSGQQVMVQPAQGYVY